MGRGARTKTIMTAADVQHADREQLAAMPTFMRDYVAEHGPYLYHVTSARQAEQIAVEGLLADQDSRFDGYRRPGCVYLATLPIAYEGLGYWGDTVLAVDVRRLDGAAWRADEEYDRTDDDGIEQGWDWIERHVPDIDDEENIAASLESGSVAYARAIPPTALRALHVEDLLHPAHPSHA